MMYEEYSIRELQAECKLRGLPSGRSKGELINRLYQDDKSDSSTKYAEPEVPFPEVLDGVYQVVYPRYGQELTDEDHMELRVKTYMAAIQDGYQVRSGIYSAWRIRTEGGNHTYGVRVTGRGRYGS